MRVAAIILAAGASTRMGSPKQLLRYQGRTLLRGRVEQALWSACSAVYVVVGCEALLIKSELKDLAVRVVENADWASGMGSSVRCGVRAAGDVDSVVLILADQPHVDSAAINQLISAGDASLVPVVASAYNDTLGVPALFKRIVFPDLLALDSHQGAKRVIEAYGSLAATITLPQAAIDIDTPEDYRALAGVQKEEFHGGR